MSDDDEVEEFDPYEQCIACGAYFTEEHTDDCPFLDDDEDFLDPDDDD